MDTMQTRVSRRSNIIGKKWKECESMEVHIFTAAIPPYNAHNVEIARVHDARIMNVQKKKIMQCF
jgi:hypothetical protein